jgi:hypothetical protein
LKLPYKTGLLGRNSPTKRIFSYILHNDAKGTSNDENKHIFSIDKKAFDKKMRQLYPNQFAGIKEGSIEYDANGNITKALAVNGTALYPQSYLGCLTILTGKAVGKEKEPWVPEIDDKKKEFSNYIVDSPADGCKSLSYQLTSPSRLEKKKNRDQAKVMCRINNEAASNEAASTPEKKRNSNKKQKLSDSKSGKNNSNKKQKLSASKSGKNKTVQKQKV